MQVCTLFSTWMLLLGNTVLPSLYPLSQSHLLSPLVIWLVVTDIAAWHRQNHLVYDNREITWSTRANDVQDCEMHVEEWKMAPRSHHSRGKRGTKQHQSNANISQGMSKISAKLQDLFENHKTNTNPVSCFSLLLICSDQKEKNVGNREFFRLGSD